MELIVIRHALPIRVEQAQGAADPALSDAGVSQAEHMARYLSTERIDALFTSPMRRARETAAPLAAELGLEPTVIDGVKEYDHAANEYVPVEELKASGDPRWAEMLDDGATDEALSTEFFDRVVGSLERIVDDHPGQTVAVVCHGGVINAYLTHVLGLPFKLPGGIIYPNYTSIHRFAAARSGERSILTINETAHLRGTGLPVGLFERA